MRIALWISVFAVSLVASGCKGATVGAGQPETPTEEPTPAEPPAAGLAVSSVEFEHEAPIPARFTCDGDDLSPALAWSGVPEGVASMALICDDPDAPVGTWIHWVLFDLPPDTAGLPEGVQGGVDVGGLDGKNSWKKTGYGGPCPPKGPAHRYYFRLYALDTKLDLKPGATRKQVDQAMEGHVLAEATLMGTYERAE